MGLIWGCAPGLALTLLFCLQDTGGNLNFNPPCATNLLPLHPRDSVAANCPSLPAGYRPGPPYFHLFANCAGGEGEGEEIQKVNC